mgnify:CR=1 FL=1
MLRAFDDLSKYIDCTAGSDSNVASLENESHEQIIENGDGHQLNYHFLKIRM